MQNLTDLFKKHLQICNHAIKESAPLHLHHHQKQCRDKNHADNTAPDHAHIDTQQGKHRRQACLVANNFRLQQLPAQKDHKCDDKEQGGLLQITCQQHNTAPGNQNGA